MDRETIGAKGMEVCWTSEYWMSHFFVFSDFSKLVICDLQQHFLCNGLI